jgi:mono/diheme cytochrome c family protein
MGKIRSSLSKFFFPGQDTPLVIRLLPFAVILIVVAALVIGTSAAWEATNSTVFCGTACHTMPPQYITHQASTHSRVTCEECHLGRATLATQIGRKIYYSWRTGSATVTGSYEYPIRATEMRPANEACETCHYPQTFTGDKLMQLDQYQFDEENTKSTIFLLMKTGGGSKREGLGRGIHWHIENPVYYYAADIEQQQIPYIMSVAEDGTIKEYYDVGADVKQSIPKEKLEVMDCNTCHNRTSHGILTPGASVDSLISRGLISQEIPSIKQKASELLAIHYTSKDEFETALATLDAYYKANFNDYYQSGKEKLDAARNALRDEYYVSQFPDQEMFYDTHPDNIGHDSAPGCFRCHDGKHLTLSGEAIRLECNMCHSIPVQSASGALTANLEVGRGIEPESHLNTNWITLHRQAFDNSCQACHTVGNPGGTDNSSFCSNSACHGSSWTYAGFDAPGLREALADQIPTPTSSPVTVEPSTQPTIAPSPAGGTPVYTGAIATLFTGKCGGCHGETGMKGLTLTSYSGIMKGSADGSMITPGDAAGSKLIKVQQSGHPGVFTPDELASIIEWINSGAKE